MHRTFWNADQDEQLRRLRAAGLSNQRIADEMGESRNAVIGRVFRLKLTLPAGERIAARRLREQGAPMPSRPGKIASLSPDRRNPSHNILAAIAIARAEPGLSEKLKGAVPDGTGIKLVDLTELTCRFPRGDPKTPDFEFCGARPMSPLPYCARHCALAYQPEYCRYRADKELST
jgi:GcrA cell cycle regulator